MELIKNWGFRMILLYGGFVILMLSLVFIATNNMNDLVAVNYYDQEIAYEGQIQKLRSTKALKEPLVWSLKGRILQLQFPKITAAPKGSLTLYRASDARQDRTIPIAADATGQQSVDLSVLSKGVWRMKVQWEAEGKPYYNEDDLFLE